MREWLLMILKAINEFSGKVALFAELEYISVCASRNLFKKEL